MKVKKMIIINGNKEDNIDVYTDNSIFNLSEQLTDLLYSRYVLKSKHIKRVYEKNNYNGTHTIKFISENGFKYLFTIERVGE